MRSSRTASPMATKLQGFFPDLVDFSTISIWLSDFPIIVTLNRGGEGEKGLTARLHQGREKCMRNQGGKKKKKQNKSKERKKTSKLLHVFVHLIVHRFANLILHLPCLRVCSRGGCAAPGSPWCSVRTSGASLGSMEKSHDQVGQLLWPEQRRSGANCRLPLPASKIFTPLWRIPSVALGRSAGLC